MKLILATCVVKYLKRYYLFLIFLSDAMVSIQSTQHGMLTAKYAVIKVHEHNLTRIM